MGLHDLQAYIEENCPKASIKVDLGKVAWRKRAGQSVSKPHLPISHITPLFVVVDVESCLHRLYGSSFTDWICGGQWTQMLQFVHNFTISAWAQNIRLVFFFNGCLENQRLQDWSKEQIAIKNKVKNNISHTQRKGTPPPRAWFVPPVALQQCLRLALLDCGVVVAQSEKDHHREIMAYCRGNAFHGILGHSADFILFDPPRYFSSNELKLSRDSRIITTTQFLIEELSKHLDIPTAAMPLVGTLLGNHILLEEDVAGFQWRLVDPEHMDLKLRANRSLLPSHNELIPAIAQYIKQIPDPDDLDAIAKDVFSFTKIYVNEKISKFKDSINYYRSATRNGGRAPMSSSTNKITDVFSSNKHKEILPKENDQNQNEIEVDKICSSVKRVSISKHEAGNQYTKAGGNEAPGTNIDTERAENTSRQFVKVPTPPLPSISTEVMRIALHRHICGKMHPYVFQVLNHGEIKLPVSLEDDQNHTLPSYVTFYKMVRQYIYGVLFSISEKPPQNKVLIKEWWATKGKSLWTPEIIEALAFTEWKVPTLHTLWLGREPEDKNRRIRAFLSCFRSDTPNIANQQIVPPHILMLACVLRYITHTAPILRKYEVDAILATALSPMLNPRSNAQNNFETPELTVRGILIASLLMEGVKLAMFANDVCGSPIPPLMCAPWNYFDGRIFQRKLAIASKEETNLVEICEGHVECVARVEQLRQAILDSCPFPFAKSPYPPVPPHLQHMYPHQGLSHPCNAMQQPMLNVPRGFPKPLPFQPPNHLHAPNYTQLKVVGVTIGNWAGGGDRGDHVYFPSPALGGYQSFDTPTINNNAKRNLYNDFKIPTHGGYPRMPEAALKGGGDGVNRPMRPFYLD